MVNHNVPDPENIWNIIKHRGSSVMVWICMVATGVDWLVFLGSMMDQYVSINL